MTSTGSAARSRTVNSNGPVLVNEPVTQDKNRPVLNVLVETDFLYSGT
jgi:hypothetical protein